MAIDHQHFYLPEKTTAARGLARRVAQSAAVQDVVVVGYLVLLTVIAALLPRSAAQHEALVRFVSLLTFVAGTVVLVRGGLVRHSFVAPLAYRVAIYGGVQLTYFFFGGFLPLVNHSTSDQKLLDLDLAMFGIEPAMWMDRWVTPVTTEWFSFFYFGYFFVLALHVIPILLLVRQRRVLGEFALGLILLFCTGHVIYMMVPGYGPYRAMPGAFAHSLPAGLWHDLVMNTVKSGGAMMDIFPSLHTAAPTFLALYSFRHRDKLPFRYTWPVVAFCAINIIGATMFLRWHYVIDVIAGLLLASLCVAATVRITSFELSRRARLRLMPTWPEFFRDATAGELPQVDQCSPTPAQKPS